MKGFFKTILIVLFFIGIITFAKGWQLITDGFRLDKIRTELIEKSDQNISDKVILSVIDQKFHYLSKGSQTYVFESEDQNYVLKFIRYKRYEMPFWVEYLDFFKKGKELKRKKLSHKDRLLTNSLLSYQFAKDYLKDETGVLYVHLNKSKDLPIKTAFIDRLNRKYEINLNEYGFVLQKKAKTLESVLRGLVNKGDSEGIKEVLNSFLETITKISRKGFINADYNCVKNSGYLNGKVIEIDLGSFIPKDLSDPLAYKSEMVKFTKYFIKWANKNYPEIIPYYESLIEEFAKKY